MSIKLESTTDSEQAVTAALGGLASKAKVEEQSAPAEKADVKDEDSETSSVKEDEKEVATDGDTEDENDSNEDEESEDENGEQKPKRKSGFKRRVDKLNARISEREKEIEFWKQKALQQKQDASQDQQSKPAAKPAAPEGKPDPDIYETHDEYLEALVDWKAEQKLASEKAKAKEVEAKTAYERRIQAHVERVQAFAEKHEDFQDALDDVDDIPMSVALQEIILESDNGPQLMYELAKNRDELERIAKLSPLAAAREMGKFEARISSNSKTEIEIKKSKAPPPIKPLGSKSASVSKQVEDMDYQEYKRYRAAQQKK